jgi:hypothetical protein
MGWLRRKNRARSPSKSLTPEEAMSETPTTDVVDTDDGEGHSETEKVDATMTAESGLGKTTSSVSTDSNMVYPSGLRLAVVVISLCFAIFLVALDQTIIATAMSFPLFRFADFIVRK